MITAEKVGLGILIAECAVIFLAAILTMCCGRKPVDGAGAEGRPDARVAEAAAPLPAPAPAVELACFPYSAGSRRASEKVECAICLGVFEHGENCSEVPACRHLFHRECIGAWMKSSATCPLCRRDMVTGSELVSAAIDMV
jgi:hypothetical protein